MHAGEWGGPESVRAALRCRSRGSITACVRSRTRQLVAELAGREIVLDCCPTSNVVLGVYHAYENHPLPTLLAAGVRVTLGSDDPPYFGATIPASTSCACSGWVSARQDLREITLTAIDAAFCDEELKATLRRRL